MSVTPQSLPIPQTQIPSAPSSSLCPENAESQRSRIRVASLARPQDPLATLLCPGPPYKAFQPRPEWSTLPGVGDDRTRGHSRPEDADPSAESGWVATDVAARAVRVSPRTIRRYIDQGKLEAKPQGKGVRREWLVSVDSLLTLRASQTTEEDVPDIGRGGEYADSIADVLREMSVRLESRAEEAAELRVRLELTERAQSTLEDERGQALQELEEERRQREEAERQREDMRRELDALREAQKAPETVEEVPESAELHPATGEPQEAAHRPWWRRWFGG
jgi:hypothetical protein